MRIAVSHTTHYRFANPAWHGLQRLRLTPRSCPLQDVTEWSVNVEGGTVEARYEDHNLNPVTLVSFDAGGSEISVSCSGVVETRDEVGVAGKHSGFMPLWAFLNQTPLTQPGPRMAELVRRFDRTSGNTLEVLHTLSDEILAAVRYEAGRTDADTTAEAALAAGYGVCQDHAHIFLGAARALGVPARYVSGYLLMDDAAADTGNPEASAPDTGAKQSGHGWAEAHVEGLGWVGFDVSNAMCPDERYVRLAIGADYRDAAPITGLSQGAGDCEMTVSLHVAEQAVAGQVQQQAQQQVQQQAGQQAGQSARQQPQH